PSFQEVAEEWFRTWEQDRAPDRQTNTPNQYRATLRMFASFWGQRPVREITEADAARFVDLLASLGGHYRSDPKVKQMSFAELTGKYGGQGKPLSAQSLNRHVNRLSAVWVHAKRRGLASGENPFEGLRRSVKRAHKEHFKAWGLDELQRLLVPPPERRDLHELILVGLFSALRINEAASLAYEDIKQADGVWFFDITAAKTEAGVRQVPVHSALSWLVERKRSGKAGRIWPRFRPEGPGQKPGENASRRFGYFKKTRGFEDRWKAFHSFRRNVTTQMENARVPVNEWQEIFGHEKGFTNRTYSEGLTMARKAEIIEIIRYPGLSIDPPA
ncbi:hypothetical protein CCR85_12610, partial [Rhodothalassium salexigens]|uniref:tyrosine-type recombinase/integrase n=1 Tax=Rhodothalassium salexigens TaxID=1086 RepID=UPI00191407ED